MVEGARRSRVLVVDDDRSIRMLVRRALRADHEVFEAASGQEALDIFVRGERYDVVLCDMMMPGMTGKVLYERLQELAPEQCDRMVFICGGALTHEVGRFLARRRTIDKPFRPQELRRAVAALLG
jgi:CheY-like chemotaxis protein